MQMICFFMRSACRHLRHYNMRSLLTTSSISVGVASLISIQALGSGARIALKEQLQQMGTNYIFISNTKTAPNATTKHPATLTMHDAQILTKRIPDLYACSPLLSIPVHIQAGRRSLATELKAGNEQLFGIIRRAVAVGSRITAYHVEHALPVCVLGSQAAHILCGTLPPIGKIITINQIPYTVIGVLAPLDNTSGSANNDVFAPISTAQRTLLGTKKNRHKVHALVLSATTARRIPDVVRTAGRILRTQHRLAPHEPDFFSVTDQNAMYQASKASRSMLQWLLLCITLIMLCVSGIGLSNVMLVSIMHRKHEIGLRMALGATPTSITIMFLIEAVLLCLAGGTLGCILGFLLCAGTYLWWHIPIVLHLYWMFFSLALVCCIGLVCGAYPAYKAARLCPIDALRST